VKGFVMSSEVETSLDYLNRNTTASVEMTSGVSTKRRYYLVR
jgi:hypothetical protein